MKRILPRTAFEGSYNAESLFTALRVLLGLLTSVYPCTLVNDEIFSTNLASAWNHRRPWRIDNSALDKTRSYQYTSNDI